MDSRGTFGRGRACYKKDCFTSLSDVARARAVCLCLSLSVSSSVKYLSAKQKCQKKNYSIRIPLFRILFEKKKKKKTEAEKNLL